MLSLELCRWCSRTVSYAADHVPDWQPRILQGMIEVRSVVVNNTHTHKYTHTHTHTHDEKGTKMNAIRNLHLNSSLTGAQSYLKSRTDHLYCAVNRCHFRRTGVSVL